MVEFPGRSESADTDGPFDDGARLTCTFQDGRLHVGDAELRIERPGRSRFDDKRIDFGSVRAVTYEKRLVIKNTLHFGRGKRDCARQARDAIRDAADV
ncbi:hypothetical protein BRD11_00340 [Halobacteriales archaeon SW_12_69_24]|nr:MAG: hypothetical protein BRD11_00340 [Halobacteriales archaeon SW_12_69_24]